MYNIWNGRYNDIRNSHYWTISCPSLTLSPNSGICVVLLYLGNEIDSVIELSTATCSFNFHPILQGTKAMSEPPTNEFSSVDEKLEVAQVHKEKGDQAFRSGDWKGG